MNTQKVVILGSTGSIGRQALEIMREQPDRFRPVALSCNSNWQELARQIREYQPDYALLCDSTHRDELRREVGGGRTELLFGSEGLTELAVLPEADTVLNSLVGFAGFHPTVRALEAGKKVALANKESLVVGGELIRRLAGDRFERLVPVDSEHSAMLQCIVGEEREKIEKIVITASGGPFRTWSREEMLEVTVGDALDHPNWSMGNKITVDSATMMNKGLEIIETHWLFGLPLSRIQAVVHPQSVIHSVVTFVDGSSKAQLGPPTMKVPILYALTYPGRVPLDAPRLDWSEAFELTFEPVDTERFPCVRLAVQAAREGGMAPAVLNAANEIAVQRFLNEEIPYIEIPEMIETCLEQVKSDAALSVESLKEIDREARELALTL